MALIPPDMQMTLMLPKVFFIFFLPKMMLKIPPWAGQFFAFILLFFCSASAHAVSLQSSLELASHEQGNVAALHIVIPAGFHAYGHEPGEGGRPTSIDFFVEDTAFPVSYPEGSMQRDYYDPDVTVFVYEGQASFFIPLPLDAPGKAYHADVSLLLCSRQKCIPVNERLSGLVPQASAPLESMPWFALWKASRAASNPADDQYGQHADAQLLPDLPAPSEPQRMMPPPEFVPFQLTPQFVDASLEIVGLGKALLLGMIAGLLLNMMPCVLPVLTFKIGGLLLLGGDSRASIKRFREHNLFFAAGVMTLFSLLALLFGLADLMWGQLYQNQTVLLTMLMLVFLMGLSMLGVFTLPIVDFRIGQDASKPRLQAYSTGLIATFLATPCSGPLLGGVLGWAFTQPLYIVMIVFWAVGLGMALPYVLFSIWPRFVRIFPKPGAWMHSFERIMGFFLLGTSLYLLSILPAEKHMRVLAVLLFIAFCAWLWGRYGSAAAPLLRRRMLGSLMLCCFLASVLWLARPLPSAMQWEGFTPDRFTQYLGKKPLLLEFTADWCPNCKFVEASVLVDERLRKWQTRYGMHFMRVDMTSTNAYAIRLLEALGSKSIPVTALFPLGDGAREPLVLRDVYSVRTLERALEKAFAVP